MKKAGNILRAVSFAFAVTAAVSCGKSSSEDTGTAARQSFTVVVQSAGELFSSETVTKRPISSVAPTQTFDRLSLIIVENAVPAKVVYKKTVDGWSSTDNRASIPWSNEEGQGRYATLVLEGDECLSEGGSYLVYAIGYQTGTYGDYEPFRDVNVGDNYKKTEVAHVPAGENADEIFAGADIFTVKDGVIGSITGEEAGISHAMIVLRRQVAGTFGYLTGIPSMVDGSPVACVRLVTTRRNSSVIFGGFRSVDDSEHFNKENVVNGMNPGTDYDASLAGSTVPDAFVVYDIDLCKWFPGNVDNSLLPLDSNGDGILDSNDSNWTIDKDSYPDGSISLPAGSVFGDRFLIAVGMTGDDIAEGLPTFQMQLVGIDGSVLRHWDVILRDTGGDDAPMTIVSLPEGEEGRTVITESDNIDTETCYSIVRNRLYTIGEKSYSQGYGEDEPVNLSTAVVLVLDQVHEWRISNSVIFG